MNFQMAIERSNRMSKSIRIPNNITLKNLFNSPHYDNSVYKVLEGHGTTLQKALNNMSSKCPKGVKIIWAFFNQKPYGTINCQSDGLIYYPDKHNKKDNNKVEKTDNSSKTVIVKLDKIIHLLEHNENHTKSFNNKNDLHFYMPHTRNFDTQLKSLNKQLHKDINLNWNIYVHATDSSISYFSLQITDGKGSDFEQCDNGMWHYSPSDIVSKAEMKAVASLISSFCKQEDMPIKELKEV